MLSFLLKVVIILKLIAFIRQRFVLVEFLENAIAEDLNKSALHPRLQTPMKIIYLAFFVAEHDDHHLAYITYLKGLFL